MNTPRSKIAAALCGLASAFAVPAASGALLVTTYSDADILASSLFSGSSGLTILPGATLIGNTVAAPKDQQQQGTFSGGTTVGGADGIGIGSGVILTTGTAKAAVGPNNSASETGQAGGPGDADLSALLGGALTTDANVLTLRVRPDAAGTLRFTYVFASEEYNELETGYDDVFGLWVDGLNKAMVAISTVNCGSASRGTPPPGPGVNCGLFVNNDFDVATAPFDIQYDGFTRVLTALVDVSAGVEYDIKLAIADVGPRGQGGTDAYDSAVFIAGEFQVDHGNGAPEPASMALAGIALLAVGAARRRARAAVAR